jgi:hypothetical protein
VAAARRRRPRNRARRCGGCPTTIDRDSARPRRAWLSFAVRARHPAPSPCAVDSRRMAGRAAEASGRRLPLWPGLVASPGVEEGEGEFVWVRLGVGDEVLAQGVRRPRVPGVIWIRPVCWRCFHRWWRRHRQARLHRRLSLVDAQSSVWSMSHWRAGRRQPGARQVLSWARMNAASSVLVGVGLQMRRQPLPGLRQPHQVLVAECGAVDGGENRGQLGAGGDERQLIRQPPRGSSMCSSLLATVQGHRPTEGEKPLPVKGDQEQGAGPPCRRRRRTRRTAALRRPVPAGTSGRPVR